MAKDNISLKVNRSDYERMLERVKGYANQLDTKISNFQTLKSRMREFIGESDDNFDDMEKTVDKYIIACHKEHALIEQTIKTLTKVLNDMTRFSEATRQSLENAQGIAKNAIDIGIDVATNSLLDILK